MRWKLLLSLTFGFATIGVCFLAIPMHNPLVRLLLFLIAVDTVLLCMGFAQDDGIARQSSHEATIKELPTHE